MVCRDNGDFFEDGLKMELNWSGEGDFLVVQWISRGGEIPYSFGHAKAALFEAQSYHHN